MLGKVRRLEVKFRRQNLFWFEGWKLKFAGEGSKELSRFQKTFLGFKFVLGEQSKISFFNPTYCVFLLGIHFWFLVFAQEMKRKQNKRFLVTSAKVRMCFCSSIADLNVDPTCRSQKVASYVKIKSGSYLHGSQLNWLTDNKHFKNKSFRFFVEFFFYLATQKLQKWDFLAFWIAVVMEFVEILRLKNKCFFVSSWWVLYKFMDWSLWNWNDRIS